MPIAPVGPGAPARTAAELAVPTRSFGALLEQRAARLGPPPQLSSATSAALELARGIEQAQRRLDAVLEAARGGRTFTARELLSLQAQAYRYSQTLELASKVVEHGAQTVKQAVSTQV
jgi:hypothetical protein